MFIEVNTMIIRAITPVHAGSGRALGLIDMPIQKEKHTGIPKIEGTSLKGSMRELYNINKDDDSTSKLFGPDNGSQSAGLIGFTDAKLLFYPVISVNTLFSYVTCPYLLNRYFEDLELSDIENSSIKLPAIQSGKCILLNDNTYESPFILDQYSFEILKNRRKYEKIKNKFSTIGLKTEKDIVIISDEDFIEVISLCKDIITRNKIDHTTGTVIDGGVFTEEYLPSESVLYSLVLKNGIKTDYENLYSEYIKNFPDIAQIGGDATVGKGIVELGIITKSQNDSTQNEEGAK